MPDTQQKSSGSSPKGLSIKSQEKSRIKTTRQPTPSQTPSGIETIDELFNLKKEKMTKRRLDQMQEEEERKIKARQEQEVRIPSSGKHVKKVELAYTRDDTTKIQKGEWASDGLGGVFDVDGWTGRTESGMKIYKHHLFNKKNAGKTKDCPFDCDCCYI